VECYGTTRFEIRIEAKWLALMGFREAACSGPKCSRGDRLELGIWFYVTL